MSAVRRGLRRYLSDLRASRAFVAGEVTDTGWLNLGSAYALRDPNPLMRSASRQHLVDLMEEAERIRTTLTVVGAAGTGAPDTGTPGVAEVIAQAVGLPHGYWAALTVLIVLRPDYGSTLQRGLQRAAGTVLGAGLGVATVLLAHLGNDVLLVAIGVSLFAAYAVFPDNYLFFAVFLTDCAPSGSPYRELAWRDVLK